ncbi:MAG TPA: PfkB family carbohydrate kinase [Actinomycetota bacterium]|nr:PfkB family carbohydrate kinase [Actinomycetota bacterium]
MTVRVAVVGHVEWVEFARVPHLPVAGEILHASSFFGVPGGGGPVTAVQLLKLAGACTFFTALGDDELGHKTLEELRRLGLRVEATFRPEAQRRAFTYLDDRGERTITVIGERLGPNGDDDLPWDELADFDAVYFTAGDPMALRKARAARVLVAALRAKSILAEAGVRLDVVIGSARDGGEVYEPIEPTPGLVVLTRSSEGGEWTADDGRSGSWDPVPPPGPPADAYGCGDSFAGGLTYGLGAGFDLADALHLGAVCGATCFTGHGPYERQYALG